MWFGLVSLTEFNPFPSMLEADDGKVLEDDIYSFRRTPPPPGIHVRGC